MKWLAQVTPKARALLNARKRFEDICDEYDLEQWQDKTPDEIESLKQEIVAIGHTMTENSIWIEQNVPKRNWHAYIP